MTRLVILGFMGAGKSTVGPLVATGLGWDFVDLDDEVARREGLSVAELIRSLGLAHFREVESSAGRRVLKRHDVVLAVGGGWAAEPGRMATLGRGTLSVFLHVTPGTALARIGGSPTPRPLLEVPDPLAAATVLLQERIAHYRASDITIDTEDRTPEEVSREVLRTPALQGFNKEESA